MSTPLLALKGVTKSFEGLTAVNDVTFEVNSNDITLYRVLLLGYY